MKKLNFYTELAYVFGMLFLALGTAFMEKADFGVSMVVAPAYIIYLKLSSLFSFVTFGISEYILQASLLLLMILILRNFRLHYLFSFVTTIIYGIVLDLFMKLMSGISEPSMIVRVILYTSGLLLCSLGVAMYFRTYISPAVYELFVKKVAEKFGKNISRFKTFYDCISCLVGVVLSFAFFGFMHFEGIKLGTVICALVNGSVIGFFGKSLDRMFVFTDLLPMRRFFETEGKAKE